MFLFDFFRSFLPLHNPIGFGAGDFIELALAALLVSLVLLRARIEPAFQRLAARTGWSMLLLAALPVALRLLLLPRHPVPTPAGADSFSYILLADTLRHFRLANPPHPLHQFFETVFVLQDPSYSSIYPLGQGLVLALGWTHLRPSLGGRGSFRGGPVLAVLLDAAGLDHAGVGAGGRAAGGNRIRPAQRVDEHLLGRRSGRYGRLPGVWRAAQAAPPAPHARRGLAGPRPGDPSAHPAV